MDKDFQQAEALRNAQQKQQDLDDYNHEMAGVDTGRLKRFGFDRHQQAEWEQQKKRQQDATLQELLLNAEYQAAWDKAIEALNGADDAVYSALVEAGEALGKARTAHEALLENADTLPDGQKVFRDVNGTVYTQQGKTLSAAELADVTHHSHAPSWEAFKHSRDRLTEADLHHTDVLEKEHRLTDIRNELEDQNHPASLERVQALELEAHDIKVSVQPEQVRQATLEVTVSPDVVPDIALPMNQFR